jgi:hypothetical protein
MQGECSEGQCDGIGCMGLAGLVGTGGPGERGEQNPIDALAYTAYECKVRRSMGTLSKRLVEGPGAFVCYFRWYQDGVEMEKRGKTREKTTRLVRSRLRNFWHVRAENATSLCNFCAHS